jgi:8-oxo-dGTP pyrophosphatase MutT (NUDIX family)
MANDEQALITAVRATVAGFDARTPREVESRRRFLAELDRLPRPFDEDADPVHVTGSAIIAGPQGVVLHFHKRLHMWLQTGGHVEPGETPWDAALRESHEETGLPLRHSNGAPHFVHLDVHPAAKGHTHLDLRYLLEPVDPDAQPAPPAGESQQVRWFTWDGAIEAADAGLVDALHRLRPQNHPG